MKILIVEDEFNAREGLANIIKKPARSMKYAGKPSMARKGIALH